MSMTKRDKIEREVRHRQAKDVKILLAFLEVVPVSVNEALGVVILNFEDFAEVAYKALGEEK